MRYFKGFARAVNGLRRADRGTALLEFGVILPLLTLVAVGVIDYGRVYFTAIKVANAAEAGAQYGSQSAATSRDTANIRIVAQNDAGDAGGAMTVSSQQFCQCAGVGVDCLSSCATYTDRIPASLVQVTTRKTVNLTIHYPGFPASILVQRIATFRVQ